MALRRRVKRDLILVAGVVAVLAVGAAMNYSTGLSQLISKYESIRTTEEEKRAAQGIEILSWKLMRATTGRLATGATFSPELLAKDGTKVNLVGFMVPLEQFNNMTEFLVLPLPLECYFCNIPPARDVMFVKMKAGSTVKLYEEPVLMNGTIRLHKEAGSKFFYTLEDAEVSGGLTQKPLKPEHTVPNHQPDVKLEEGYEPPKPVR